MTPCCHCPTCGAGEFAGPADRITIIYPAGIGIVVPCPECMTERAWAFAVRWVANNNVIEDDGIERRDPWDLPETELNAKGPTSAEMVAAEQRYEHGLIRYTNRGGVRS